MHEKTMVLIYRNLQERRIRVKVEKEAEVDNRHRAELNELLRSFQSDL